MQVSVREVFDLAERCFCVADFPPGSARANAATVWWTELTKGTGLTLLHGLLDDLPGLDRTRLTRRGGAAVSIVDGDGQPSVVSGTPALDLCCARAARRGLGVTYATIDPQDDTAAALGHVAYEAAERGLSSVVLYANCAGDARTVAGSPAQPHPIVGETELRSPSVAYTAVLEAIESGIADRPDGLLTHALFDGDVGERTATADERLVTGLLEDATTPADERPDAAPGFVTVCVDPTQPSQPRRVERVVEGALEGADAFTDVFRPAEVGRRAETLLHEGVDVDEAVWRDVFEYSSGVLAPEFEGSYRGAGFEINQ